jgi:hypothetical protein
MAAEGVLQDNIDAEQAAREAAVTAEAATRLSQDTLVKGFADGIKVKSFQLAGNSGSFTVNGADKEWTPNLTNKQLKSAVSMYLNGQKLVATGGGITGDFSADPSTGKVVFASSMVDAADVVVFEYLESATAPTLS